MRFEGWMYMLTLLRLFVPCLYRIPHCGLIHPSTNPCLITLHLVAQFASVTICSPCLDANGVWVISMENISGFEDKASEKQQHQRKQWK